MIFVVINNTRDKFNKGKRQISKESTVISTNYTGITGYLFAREKKEIGKGKKRKIKEEK